MEIESAKSASDLLVHHWREDRVLDGLPTFLRPTNREEVYIIQRQIEALSDKPLLGWKMSRPARSDKDILETTDRSWPAC